MRKILIVSVGSQRFIFRNIINWVNENERYKQYTLGVYMAKKMEETRFRDLSICLWKNYLYCHCGDCQHQIVFTDFRHLKKFRISSSLTFEFPG